MGQFCVVYGCANYSSRNKGKGKSYYRIPAIVKHHNDEKTKYLSETRRQMWIMNINRKNWVPTKFSYVCSDHFITGQPARLYDTTNPDWVPTVNMGKQVKNKHVKNSKFKKQRYPNQQPRQGKRPITVIIKDNSMKNNNIKENNSMKENNILSDSSSHSLEWLSCISSPVIDIDLPPEISIQTTLTMSAIQTLERKVVMLEAENKALREELYKSQVTADECNLDENSFVEEL